MKHRGYWCCGMLLLASPIASQADLLCRAGLLTVEGKVVRIEEHAREEVKGIPRMSGTLDEDRVRPAHYELTLEAYSGITTLVAAQMAYDVEGNRCVPEISWDDLNQGVQPPQIVVLLTKKWRQRALKKLKPGTQIRVVNYRVTGDEGGCWASYEKVVILSSDTAASSN